MAGLRTRLWLPYVFEIGSLSITKKTSVSSGDHAYRNAASWSSCGVHDAAYPHHHPRSVHAASDRDDLMALFPYFRVQFGDLFRRLRSVLPRNSE